MAETSPSRISWQAKFIALAAIWGSSFLFIKVADEHMAPVFVALGRVALGAITLVCVLGVRRERLPSGWRVWMDLTAIAVLFNSVPFLLFAWGETRVSSVVAGIWNGTTPLLVLAVALVALPDERPTRRRVAGLGLGFAGVVTVLGPWTGLNGHELVGNLACLGGAVCYGLGFPYTRRRLAGRAESGVALSAGQLMCATVQLGAVAPLLGSLPGHLPANAAGSLLALGVLGTGFAYILNYAVIREVGATTASTVTYAIPLFSTALGVIVLGEGLTWHAPVGAVVVLLGIALAGRSAAGPDQTGCESPGSSTITSDDVRDSTSDLKAPVSVSIGGKVP